ncbi:UbiA prenyltransferase [Schizopora paradoxa]|uniref:4-hydroxybenzoate polyprenyltransferase, mitochondrial n=1 Tax=Schizopora paradoxa TaxID=27342 RepID=A0A0H2RUL0_9AGAM|nr:UbiA prenyltransferase [Schizopora paradoxa]
MPIQPYLELARIHKPAGFFLVLWPPFWGLTMAAFSTKMAVTDYLILLLKSFLAAFIIRSSACTVNDIFDRNFDGLVARTKNRPLASGRVTLSKAIYFLLLQYAVGVSIFATFNKAAFYSNMIQMIPLSCSYPLFKRITNWPQAWLGLAINFGFVTSWTAVHGTSPTHFNFVVLMSLALWCWTMAYDTAYACLDRKDDAKIGLHSTALLFGQNVVPAISCLAIGFVSLLCISGFLNNHGAPYYALSVGGPSLFFLIKLVNLDVESFESCWDFFIQNAYFLGSIIFVGLLFDYLRLVT